jgi:hypothetical protein
MRPRDDGLARSVLAFRDLVSSSQFVPVATQHLAVIASWVLGDAVLEERFILGNRPNT